MGRSKTQTFSRNHRNENSRVYPELVVTPTAAGRESTYYAALELVAHIDETLSRGTRHYRNRAGELLTTLDEVVHAILDNDLQLPEAHEEPELLWVAPQELAA
jgi:hypothetical protein